MITLQLVGAVVYLALALSVGSPDSTISVIINFVLIAAMTFAASIGLRSVEVRVHAAFAVGERASVASTGQALG